MRRLNNYEKDRSFDSDEGKATRETRASPE
jgi:hypothetical protein